MELRRFGSTDLQVSSLGVGCARIGGIFQNDAGGFVGLLQRALAEGINFFDTADMYSQGESESLIGRAFRGQRERIVIASKVGYVLPAQRRLIGYIKPLVRPLIRALKIKREQLPAAVRGAPTQDFSPGYLPRAVEGSLKRLGTDRIDFLQLHSPPLAVVERGEWLPALERLQQQGKIRHYGVACDGLGEAMAALQHPGVRSLQVTINLLEQGALETLLPAARAKGVGVIAREVLANGLLVKDAGAIDLKTYCASEQDQQRRTRQLQAVREVATRSGRSTSELALQLVQNLDGVPVALLGVRNTEQLLGLLRAAATPAMPGNEIRALPA